MGGYDPYSSSKGCTELVTAAYRRSFFAQGAGAPVVIRNPNAVRPWQHVLEPLCGYLMLAERLLDGDRAFAEGWNFGPNDADARAVGDVVEALAARGGWGGGASWRLDGGAHPHEATYLKLDSSKARARLGWTPRLALADALAWVVEWYREHDRGADARRLTTDQIARYQSMAS
jgi:CDP-glucose 4,6-dehydratase